MVRCRAWCLWLRVRGANGSDLTCAWPAYAMVGVLPHTRYELIVLHDLASDLEPLEVNRVPRDMCMADALMR